MPKYTDADRVGDGVTDSDGLGRSLTTHVLRDEVYEQRDCGIALPVVKAIKVTEF